MRTFLILLASLCSFHSVSGEVVFDWSTVGDPGNASDNGTGEVAYEFRISKHEVTNGQYAEFLGQVAREDPHELYHPDMSIRRSGESGSFRYSATPGLERHPVTYIRFFDAMRFVNWLENGQVMGGTESGTYSIDGGLSETRARNARFFLPSDDEWYKAAYYDPTIDGGVGGYWQYATRSDEFPIFDAPPGGTNSVNTANNDLGGTTEVGAYRDSRSFYGTFDQTGNVWEWNEEVSGAFRRLRGPSWGDTINFIAVNYPPDHRAAGGPYFGFRVASRALSSSGSFRRGDCNDDGNVDISDAVFALNSLFFGGRDPDCEVACDSSDDGTIDISDAISVLGALFLGQDPLPSPGMSECGLDPTPDDLDCARNEICL